MLSCSVTSPRVEVHHHQTSQKQTWIQHASVRVSRTYSPVELGEGFATFDESGGLPESLQASPELKSQHGSPKSWIPTYANTAVDKILFGVP